MDYQLGEFLRRIERGQRLILRALGVQQQEIEDMAGEIAQLETQVKANTDAEESAITLLNGLHDLLVQAGTDPAKLQKITSDLAASKDALAAAILANTPSDPNPTPAAQARAQSKKRP